MMLALAVGVRCTGFPKLGCIFGRATLDEVPKSRITRLSPSSRQLRLKQRQLRILPTMEMGNVWIRLR